MHPLPPPDVFGFDPIERPAHYLKGTIQVRDFIVDQDLSFLMGSAVQYIVRAPHKGDELTDLKKARECLDYRIRQLETPEEK